MVSVGRAASVVALLTALSLLLGFGRDVVIAAVFGASADLDAYFVAQGLMNVVLALVAGAMAKASVPVLAREARAEGARCGDHRSLDVALTVAVLVLGVGGVVMWLVAGPVVAVLAPGFDAGQRALAVTLTRVVLVATVLVAGTNLVGAAAQSHGRFGWSGFQGVPFNLTMIVAAGVFGPRYGVLALAVGFVVGSATRLLVHVPAVRAIGLRIRPSLELRHPGFREMARLVPALLLGSAIGNVNTLVDRAVGSLFADGTISALSYGWRVVNLGEMLVVASLMGALYPALGAAAQDPPELRRLVSRGLSIASVLLTPLSIALACAAVPLVTLAFARGSFGPDDVASTSSAVLWYAPALLALGWRELVVRASFAVGDSSGPVVVAAVAMLVNVAGDLTAGLRWGIPGLAAATSASLVCAAALNTWLLHRRHGALPTAGLGALLARTGGAAVVATAVGVLVARALASPGLPSTLDALWTSAGIAAAVALAYGGVLALVRAPELRLLRGHLQGVVRRR